MGRFLSPEDLQRIVLTISYITGIMHQSEGCCLVQLLPKCRIHPVAGRPLGLGRGPESFPPWCVAHRPEIGRTRLRASVVCPPVPAVCCPLLLLLSVYFCRKLVVLLACGLLRRWLSSLCLVAEVCHDWLDVFACCLDCAALIVLHGSNC